VHSIVRHHCTDNCHTGCIHTFTQTQEGRSSIFFSFVTCNTMMIIIKWWERKKIGSIIYQMNYRWAINSPLISQLNNIHFHGVIFILYELKEMLLKTRHLRVLFIYHFLMQISRNYRYLLIHKYWMNPRWHSLSFLFSV